MNDTQIKQAEREHGVTFNSSEKEALRFDAGMLPFFLKSLSSEKEQKRKGQIERFTKFNMPTHPDCDTQEFLSSFGFRGAWLAGKIEHPPSDTNLGDGLTDYAIWLALAQDIVNSRTFNF